MKTVILIVLLMLAGCTRITYKDITYERWGFGSHELNGVIVEVHDPNGASVEVLIEKQKSDFELGFEAAGLGLKAGGK